MKKSKKLLSVLLAVVMLLSSMSVLAFAAKANYKTVADLESNEAYSPYFSVTRLSTEERMSIILDFLDITLGAIENPSKTIPVLNIEINYGSVNGLLKTIDDVLSNGLVGTAIGAAKLNNKNLLGYLNRESWTDNCMGMTREGTAQLDIVSNLLRFLSDNSNVVKKLVDTGSLELGMLNGALGDIRGTVNRIVRDLPGFLKGYIYPLFERKDDTKAQVDDLLNTSKTVDETLTSFVIGLFTRPQSTTTYKEDASGNCISNHNLPKEPNKTRYYYVKEGNEYTCYAYDTDKKEWKAEPDKFVRNEELDGDGNPTGVYTYNKMKNDKPADALKYYEEGSYWLPSLVESGKAAEIMNISTNNGANMLYQMIPYVFAEMAPVVLNGSVKKSIAEWFGAKFDYVGETGSTAVAGLADSSDLFFTQEQGDYLWEWSDYAVINGNHYYRFEDSIYSSDLSNTNPYFNIVNWDFKISGNFMDEFIPGNASFNHTGRTTVLQSLNDFLIKFANTVLNTDVISSMALTTGSNDNLVENLKKAARTIVAISPESLFGDSKENVEYYDLMMNDASTNQEVLVGLACTIVDALMPQMILPKADTLKGQNVGAVLAAVVRELASQLVPDINYDALIYDDYNTKTFISGKDNGYWVDVCLTIGTDIGFKYLTALADMGEDNSVFAGANWSIKKEYTTSDIAVVAGENDAVKLWEQRVDYILDWALSEEYEWCWSFGGLVDCGSEVNLATAQDPWVKLGTVLNNILPINQILNVKADNSNNPLWLETALRDNFVLALLDLNVTKIVGGNNDEALIKVPDNSVLRTKALLPAVVNVVRDLLNAILYKGIGNQNFITFVDGQIEQLFRSDTTKVQDNLGVLAQNLLQKLYVIHAPLLKAALPIVNFFVGWTTNPQKFEEPVLAMSGYYTIDTATTNTVETEITVQNRSAGMLLKHRNSDVKDTDYELVIENITGDYTATDFTADTKVMPYGKATIKLTRDYAADEVAKAIVTYHLERNGKTIGTSKQKPIYQLITNKTSDIPGNYSQTDTKEPVVGIKVTDFKGEAATNALVTSKNDLAGAISNMSVKWTNLRDTACQITESTFTPGSNYVASSGEAEYYNNTDKWIGAAGTEATDIEITISPAKLNPDVVVDDIPSGTTFGIGSTKFSIYGTYKGVFKTYKETGTLTCDFGTVYYCDMTDLIDLVNQEKGLQRIEGNYSADSWKTYEDALKDAILFVDSPKMQGTFASTYTDTNIEAKYNALKNAADNLVETSSSSVNIEGLRQALADAEPGGEVPEVNYQDYELYEYFNYQDERTATRNTLKSYNKPEEPKRYIKDSPITADEIQSIYDDTTANTLKVDAIKATVTEPTQTDIDNWNDAIAKWVGPNNTQISIDNLAQSLTYYRQLLIARETTEKQFLQKELDYATAQSYDETQYSVDSWANYQTALTNANNVNDDANALQSQVFDAKYELMKAQNELVLATRSAKQTNAYDELNALIAKAEDIFANPDNYNVVEGVAADAYKDLIVALGYNYTNADGNPAVLYSHSAIDMVTYDREITLNNVKKIDAAEAKLQAAIDKFAPLATEPIFSGITNVVDNNTGVVDDAKQYVYGVPAGTAVEDVKNYFSVENGSFDVSGNGTGATITVKDATDTPVATYTLIIFGDVNGDGNTTGADSQLIMNKVAGNAQLTGIQTYASDVNGDDNATGADSQLIMNKVAGNASLTVNPRAK